MSQGPINAHVSQPCTVVQASQRPTTTQMSQASTNSQAPLPNFTLEGITLQVRSARETYHFLCEVFAQPNTFINWDPAAQKGRLPQLSPDGMHTDFYLSNTPIRFCKDTSTNPVVRSKITICVQVQDIVHIRQVLDGRKLQYKRGEGASPERLRWIRFLDMDGNTWHVSELRRN